MMRISSSASECRIYMAPSSLGGASFGIYTTSPIDEGEQVLRGNEGPNIPVIDPFQDESPEHSQWTQLFDNYWWGRGVADQISYEAMTVLDVQDTLGSLPNHHCILVRSVSFSRMYYKKIVYSFVCLLKQGFNITSCTRCPLHGLYRSS